MENSVDRELLLSHYYHSPTKGKLDKPDRLVHVSSRTCRDHLYLGIWVQNDTVAEARFDGHGCVISMATASLLTEYMAGKTLQHLLTLTQNDVLALVELELSAPRQRCALLAWEALRSLLMQEIIRARVHVSE